eukprot:1847583-Pyramimonas_sp.AAC.1
MGPHKGAFPQGSAPSGDNRLMVLKRAKTPLDARRVCAALEREPHFENDPPSSREALAHF